MKQFLFPALFFASLVGVWQFYVGYADVSPFVLPAPTQIMEAFCADGSNLMQAALNTLKITLIALFFAALSGVMLAFLFSVSRTFETTLYPFAVVLQVTPVIAIAPLVIIWVGLDNVDTAQIIIAWLVAFFPILANMTAGIKAIDKNLADLFTLYNASKWQRFLRLLWPTSLPYLLAGLKVGGGLSLIGAVVAEFVAGSGTSTGLAWQIIEAGNRLQIAKMFAALFLLIIIGIMVFAFFQLLEHWYRRYLRH